MATAKRLGGSRRNRRNRFEDALDRRRRRRPTASCRRVAYPRTRRRRSRQIRIDRFPRRKNSSPHLASMRLRRLAGLVRVLRSLERRTRRAKRSLRRSRRRIIRSATSSPTNAATTRWRSLRRAMGRHRTAGAGSGSSRTPLIHPAPFRAPRILLVVIGRRSASAPASPSRGPGNGILRLCGGAQQWASLPRYAEQASKSRPIRLQFRGRLIWLGEMSEDDAQSLHRGTGGSTYTRKARATREAPKRGQG